MTANLCVQRSSLLRRFEYRQVPRIMLMHNS